MGRWTRPTKRAHAVDRPELRHGASLLVWVGDNGVRPPARDDARPYGGPRAEHSGAMLSLENKMSVSSHCRSACPRSGTG
jgi:hypothetical protein